MSESANCSVALSDLVLNFTAQITGDNRSSAAPEESHPVPPSPEQRKFGQLGKQDILEENLLGDDVTADHSSLKAASFDISPSLIAVSTRTGLLERVYYEEEIDNKKKKVYYMFVHPRDTIMIVSREHLTVPKNIAGYVVSRVSNVEKGFGHISTSIDPGWNGPLIIALSNPSSRFIKIRVGNAAMDKNDSALATVTFHYLNSTPDEAIDTQKPKDIKSRLTGLCNPSRNKAETAFSDTPFRTKMIRCFHHERAEMTDRFIDSLKVAPIKTREDWKTALEALSGDCAESTDKSSGIAAYAKPISRLRKSYHFLVDHPYVCNSLIAVLLGGLLALIMYLIKDKTNSLVSYGTVYGMLLAFLAYIKTSNK